MQKCPSPLQKSPNSRTPKPHPSHSPHQPHPWTTQLLLVSFPQYGPYKWSGLKTTGTLNFIICAAGLIEVSDIHALWRAVRGRPDLSSTDSSTTSSPSKDTTCKEHSRESPHCQQTLQTSNNSPRSTPQHWHLKTESLKGRDRTQGDVSVTVKIIIKWHASVINKVLLWHNISYTMRRPK